MEKELEQNEVLQSIENSKVLFKKMIGLFVKEKSKNSVILYACINTITFVCKDKLVIPPQNFTEILLGVIDCCTK